MPKMPKSKWIAAIAATTALFALPAAAQATLVYTRAPLNPAIYAANDDGSGVHRIDKGTQPDVSPDGKTVAYFHEGPGHAQELMVAATDGSDSPRKLLAAWRESFVFAWSADSSRVAALTGPELGQRRLVVIDVASGKQQTIARGYFGGVSFDPAGGGIVYSKASADSYPPRSDIYRFDLLPPGAVSVAPVLPRRLTSDQRSLSPLWGPNDRIVFVKQLGAKQRRYGPKNELYLMNESGGQVKRLTHTKVDPLLSGLSPTQWSANGKRLLAEFGGQDTSYAVTVNPKTGAQRALTKEREIGFVGAAISADGKTVLGSIGEFEGNVPDRKVLSIPYAGGKPKVLVTNASEPDWSR
jgi:Tol biopolymer transport system component